MSPRESQCFGSNQTALKLPTRDPSYSMAPPGPGTCLTSEPNDHLLLVIMPLAQPPKSVCILRLSAIGDTCHVVPIIRTLQHVWPTTQLTWIIGKAEARLM